MIEVAQMGGDLSQVGPLMQAGRWQEAVSLLRPMVEQRPYDARAIGKLGYALWKQGDRQEGVESLERALLLDPDDGEVIKDCVRVFQECGRVQDAREILQSYLDRNPWDMEVKDHMDHLNASGPETEVTCQSNDDGVSKAALLVELGEEEFEKENLERARTCFEMALEKDPANAKAHNNLGVLAWQQGDLNGALAHLDKALDLAPTDGEILLNAARALGAAGHCDTASQLLEVYLSAHPQEADVWEEYRELVRQSVQAWRPDNLDAKVAGIYVEMGRRLADAGDVQGAAEAFARAVRLDPENAEGYLQLGLLYARLDQTDEALELLEQAQALDEENQEVAEALGAVRRRIQEAPSEGGPLEEDTGFGQEESAVGCAN
ncbi:Tfp pilus assembly protein PilF [Desulfacinum hydrothermale DSM 13146]|uniref:Tfp pilus assembly protein PilF n=1 Tax=Desulfacinum hydrothermale DSM 13146 TaxID=1121390 RepID=A0A1W1XG11_9BACT|nr:tetratricopeptide repeat protein [Desulfacinum hydrothermale]SMC22441.1 Tfp pilus assembly protein PilF [Desulfacinum hydrothermale DSM 13146]